jgi:hypothetical protein
MGGKWDLQGICIGVGEKANNMNLYMSFFYYYHGIKRVLCKKLS